MVLGTLTDGVSVDEVIPLLARIFFLVRLHQAPIECGKASLKQAQHVALGFYSICIQARIC